MNRVHLNLRGNRRLDPEPIVRAREWLREGRVGIATDIFKVYGYSEAQIQAEIDRAAIPMPSGKHEDIDPFDAAERRANAALEGVVNGFFGAGRRSLEKLRLRAVKNPEAHDVGYVKKEVPVVQNESGVKPLRKESSVFSRKRLVWLLVAIGFIMVTIPPWTYTFSQQGAAVSRSPAGYGIIFSPPEPEHKGPVFGVELDVKRLALQLVLLVSAFGMLMYTAKKEDS